MKQKYEYKIQGVSELRHPEIEELVNELAKQGYELVELIRSQRYDTLIMRRLIQDEVENAIRT